MIYHITLSSNTNFKLLTVVLLLQFLPLFTINAQGIASSEKKEIPHKPAVKQKTAAESLQPACFASTRLMIRPITLLHYAPTYLIMKILQKCM